MISANRKASPILPASSRLRARYAAESCKRRDSWISPPIPRPRLPPATALCCLAANPMLAEFSIAPRLDHQSQLCPVGHLATDRLIELAIMAI